jgi:hypothetical protein
MVERKILEHRQKGEYLVHRHVIMPGHLHVILTPGPDTTLERAAQLIKGGLLTTSAGPLQHAFPSGSRDSLSTSFETVKTTSLTSAFHRARAFGYRSCFP